MRHRPTNEWVSFTARAAFLAVAAASCLVAQDLSVSADSLVDTTYPAINFGSANYLQAGGTVKTYIQFDLSSLPAGVATAPGSKINLVLYVSRLGAPGSLQISQAAGPWSELTITSANQPGVGAPIGPVVISVAGQFVYLDLTSVVLGWLATPESNHGLVLEGVGTATLFLDSKESVTTSHEPRLELVLAGPAGATGALGATGPTGLAGLPGPTGATGIGVPGLPGLPGIMGAPGLTGATGATGATGTATTTTSYTCNAGCGPGLLQVLLPFNNNTQGQSARVTTASNTDLSGVIGIATTAAFSGDPVLVASYGNAACLFDNAVSQGDYVQASTNFLSPGTCHDAGPTYPTSNQVIGIALSSSDPLITGTTQTVYLFGTGQAGLNGPTGATGPIGATGLPGLPGVPGIPGLPGIPGSPGPTGATGATGSSGSGNLSLLTGAAGATLTTFAGGLPGLGAILPLSGFVTTATTGLVGLLTDVSGNPNTGFTAYMQPVPAAVTFQSISATSTLLSALTLIGTTVDINATLYIVRSGTITASPTSLSCSVFPELTGIIALGYFSSCINGGTAEFAAGDAGFIVVSASAVGLGLINTLTISTSVGVSTTAPPL